MTMPVASRSEAARMHAQAVIRLKAFLEEGCLGVTVCASYSEPFDRLEELAAIHRKTELGLASCLFLKGTKIAGPGTAVSLRSPDMRALPDMEGITELLRQGNPASVERLLEDVFETAAKARSVSYLTELCGTLISALDVVRLERGLPALRRLAEEGGVRTDGWRALDGIKIWLLAKIEETVTGGGYRHPYSRKIREACDYISVSYAEDLSADTIASRIGISGEHLRHLFKQETGHTLHDYITACRMERAKGLLESGHFKLYEISEKVGYKSSHYFSKIFCKTVGMTPLDYAEARGAVR
jgi:AraC-like DNA-binding protein